MTTHTTMDQAAGLRRMFTGLGPCWLPLVANPHVGGFGGVLLERITTTFAFAGVPVLLVDAASTSPAPSDSALLDLAACIEPLDAHTHYLAAQGLPRRYVDSRGSAQRLLAALTQAAPGAAVIVVHGDATDLARIFHDSQTRPLLICGSRVEAVKHAYAAGKLLAQRARLMSFDLLMCSPPSRHARAVAASLMQCLEGFLGAVLYAQALVDPATDVAEPPRDDLRHLLQEQLRLAALSHDTPGQAAPAVPHQRMPSMQHRHAWQTTTT